jgi:hypothetical protein
MADKAKPTRRGRKPKKTDPVEMAAILAHASLHDAKSAASKFSVSERTIARWRAALAAGDLPEVAKLVGQQKQKTLERCSDLLNETFDMSLRALQKKLDEMTGRQIVGACKILGELRQGRDFLSDPDPDVERSGAGESPAGDEEGAGGATTRARRTPPSSVDGDSPIH